MNTEQIKNRVSELITLSGKRNFKMRDNMRIYTNSPFFSLNDLKDSEIEGYFQANTFEISSDTTRASNINITKSCIDTLVSMISASKVRPFFNTTNGTYKDYLLAIQTQQYFDLIFDRWNMTKVIGNIFRDACIFDTGVAFIDYENKSVKRAFPWQVYFDPRQTAYDEVTEAVYRRVQSPESGYTTRYDYWNTKDHIHVVYDERKDTIKKEPYPYDELPFCVIHYSDPVKTGSSISVVDLLRGIQEQLNMLTTRLKDATEKCPIAIGLVPEDSDIDINKISNKVMQLIPYRVGVNVSANPLSVVTPEPYSQTFMQYLEELKNEARELVGLNETSLNGNKPQGVDSGVGIATMENVQNQRFQTQINNVIKLYTEVALRCIQLFDGNVLPADKNRSKIKWTDVKKCVNKMGLQFSAAEFLSKDPSEKYKQLQAMAANGDIPRTMVPVFMQIPDTERAFSIMNNAMNAVFSTITRCIEKDDYDIPVFVPYDLLKEEIRSCALSLYAVDNEENDKDIEKLMKLFDKVQELENKIQTQQMNNENMMAQTQAVNAQSAALDQQIAGVDAENAQLESAMQQIQSGQMSPEQAQIFMQSMGMK